MRIAILISLLPLIGFAQGPYAPPAGQFGTSAIHKDSSAFVAWATACVVNRSWMDIADTALGLASVGTEADAVDKAGVNGIVSLGDAGEAILTFDDPIFDGPGPDFAIFENSFSDTYLELAFVEVSSDGINYFRFDAVSLNQDTLQIDGFGSVEPTNLYNLAGKYRAQYGTPFDLAEMNGISGLDINNITHVKVIDVVGSINPQYARYDSQGNAINDPYETPFPSSGFDLDAVGVIHQMVSVNEIKDAIKCYPNPTSGALNITLNTNKDRSFELIGISGKRVKSWTSQNAIQIIDCSDLTPGIYFLSVIENQIKTVKRIQVL